jgi:hypothetical protein
MSKEVQKEERLFVTTEEILNATLQYLGSRPYAEVAHLVDGLRQSKPVSQQSVDTDAKDASQIGKMEVVDEEIVTAE